MYLKFNPELKTKGNSNNQTDPLAVQNKVIAKKNQQD